MSALFTRRFTLKMLSASALSLMIPGIGLGRADAAVTATRQSIAEASSSDPDIAAFYRARKFKPIFVSKTDGRRRGAVLRALTSVQDHGLPEAKYGGRQLEALFGSARTPKDRGQAEVEAARRFLAYADDMRSGVVNPADVDRAIVVEVARHDRTQTLQDFAAANPVKFIKGLAPRKPEYVRLQKEKRRLEALSASGGWGAPVGKKSLKLGESGPAVVQLRNRMIRMGFLRRSASQSYDAALQSAVQKFQITHGLATDGVAGADTIREVNRDVAYRLGQVHVAMERIRWSPEPLENKHIWVNLPDFHVHIMEKGRSTFRSRVVIGKSDEDRKTPEFSDVMNHMVINPSWYVPRSITTKEYLPMLQRNRGAVRHIQIIGRNGKPVNRGSIDFTKYNERNFPFAMKQPPSETNALGLVKFMFPNKYMNLPMRCWPPRKATRKGFSKASCARARNVGLIWPHHCRSIWPILRLGWMPRGRRNIAVISTGAIRGFSPPCRRQGLRWPSFGPRTRPIWRARWAPPGNAKAAI